MAGDGLAAGEVPVKTGGVLCGSSLRYVLPFGRSWLIEPPEDRRCYESSILKPIAVNHP